MYVIGWMIEYTGCHRAGLIWYGGGPSLKRTLRSNIIIINIEELKDFKVVTSLLHGFVGIQ